MKVFKTAQSFGQAINKINLSSNQIPAAWWTPDTSQVLDWCLLELNLDGCGLTSNLLVRTKLKAKRISLVGNYLCDKAAAAIADIAGRCEEIDISANKLTDKFMQTFVVELDVIPCPLKKLVVEYTDVTEKGLMLLCAALQTHFAALTEVRCDVVCEELVRQVYLQQWRLRD